MTFYTMSCGYGKKRDGRRISHLVVNGVRTTCGIKVGNDITMWSFSNGRFIKSIDLMEGSTVATQLEAVNTHVTCRSCLRMYQGE